MTRRAIDELGAAAARDRIARAIWVERENIDFFWNGDLVERIRIIEGPGKRRDLTINEHKLLARAGVFQVPGGWEIEEEVAIKPGDLFRPKQGGPVKRVVGAGPFDARDRGVRRWALTLQHPGESHIVGSSELETDLLDPAKWERVAAEPAKPERRPLPKPWRWLDLYRDGTRLVLTRGKGLGLIAAVTAGNPPTWGIDYSDESKPVPAPTIEAAQEAAERECWERGLFEENPRTGTIIGERSPASTALRRLVLRMVDRAEDGGMIDPLVYPGAAAHLSDLCDDFVSELRTELAPKFGPSPRTTDGALTAYLLEHYPDEWRPGEDALALAIRLLGETQRIVDEAHREAERSDEAAKEMAAELAKVRAELNAANSRAAEAEHDRDEARKALLIEAKERDEARRAQRSAIRERDEARADLTVLRGMIRGIAAKAGVPHG